MQSQGVRLGGYRAEPRRGAGWAKGRGKRRSRHEAREGTRQADPGKWGRLRLVPMRVTHSSTTGPPFPPHSNSESPLPPPLHEWAVHSKPHLSMPEWGGEICLGSLGWLEGGLPQSSGS